MTARALSTRVSALVDSSFSCSDVARLNSGLCPFLFDLIQIYSKFSLNLDSMFKF
jgi:hypothetical protein